MESKEAQTIHKETIVEYKNAHIMPPSCPPQNVISEDINPVYRFIDGDVPIENDFLSHKELNPQKRYPKNQKCKSTAISLYNSLEAALIAKESFKNLQDKKICEGRITKACGTLELTECTGHLSLWQFKDADLLNIFIGGR